MLLYHLPSPLPSSNSTISEDPYSPFPNDVIFERFLKWEGVLEYRILKICQLLYYESWNKGDTEVQLENEFHFIFHSFSTFLGMVVPQLERN